jgi:hypothetical protein
MVILLLSASIITMGSSEPIVTDETEDVMGLLSVLFPQEKISFLDIESVSLYENPDKSDFLYASIKFVDLTMRKWHTIYSLIWEYNEETYVLSVHYREYGTVATYSTTHGEYAEKINGAFNIDNDIVTFNIPKNKIDNPQPGDKLEKFQVLSSMRPFKRDKLILLFFAEIGMDYADSDKNYIIKY